MPRTLFDFSKMFVGCIHTEDFTNAVKREEFKILLANSYMVMQDCSNRDWKEFAENTANCHEVKSEYIKSCIGELIGWKKKEIDDLKRKLVWQIPFSQEARLFGILEKNKPAKNNNLFQTLLFDPNHKTYRKSGKNVLSSLKDLVCLFNEEEECRELVIQKSLKKSKRN